MPQHPQLPLIDSFALIMWLAGQKGAGGLEDPPYGAVFVLGAPLAAAAGARGPGQGVGQVHRRRPARLGAYCLSVCCARLVCRKTTHGEAVDTVNHVSLEGVPHGGARGL